MGSAHCDDLLGGWDDRIGCLGGVLLRSDFREPAVAVVAVVPAGGIGGGAGTSLLEMSS